MTTVADVVAFLEKLAPLQLAAAWDNAGLLLGERTAHVQRVMTCLTVTPESVAEAIAANVNLIVTHHPVLFRAVQRCTDATAEGRLLLPLLRAGVAVYSPHTAFDNTPGGINDVLARRLELIDVRPLRRHDGPRQCKLVVFVPDSDLARVSDALFHAGAGLIGKYRECSYRLAGTGTFFATEQTNPTVGQKGRREAVSEWRLEVVCTEPQVEAAVHAMRQAHSYEEPAFDVYPLRSLPAEQGEGRRGRLPTPRPLREVAASVRSALHAAAVQMVGDPTRQVSEVAIVCGAGGSLLQDAIQSGADLFLTGELRFHDYLEAQAHHVSLVLPGHYATERCGVEELADILSSALPEVTCWASRQERDPSLWLATTN